MANEPIVNNGDKWNNICKASKFNSFCKGLKNICAHDEQITPQNAHIDPLRLKDISFTATNTIPIIIDNKLKIILNVSFCCLLFKIVSNNNVTGMQANFDI